jgi:hypothetical protein
LFLSRAFALGVLALGARASPSMAQVRADPGVVIGNRVAVRVNVTLADEETPYHPVRGLTLAFTRPSSSDTVRGRTDEAGVMTVLLPAGDYVVTAPTAFPFKGTWYTWSMPVSVKPDMPAVELNRANSRVDRGGTRVVPAPARVQSSGDLAPTSGSSGTRSDGTIRWLSLEVGGEGGVTRFGDEAGSDAGYGGSGSFIGGLGPVAVGLGYRYTRISYGGGLEPGSMRGGTIELRYHLRPGAAPVRPYIGALAGVGRWYDSESLSDETSSMRMFGGTAGVQFGLATSVRLHVSAMAAGTSIRMSPESTSGLFATGNVGLTFDIFSPAR